MTKKIYSSIFCILLACVLALGLAIGIYNKDYSVGNTGNITQDSSNADLEKINELILEIEECNKIITQLETNVGELELTDAENKQMIAQLQSEANTMQLTITQHEATITENTATIADLNTQIADKQAIIDELQSDAENNATTIAQMTADIELLTQEKLGLELENESKQTTINNLNTQLETKEATISQLNNNNSALQATINEKNAEIESLNVQITNLQEQIRTLQSQIGGTDMLQAVVNARKSTNYLFSGYSGTNVDIISGLDLSQVTSAKSMFEGCRNLESVPESLVFTTDLSCDNMYKSCSVLKNMIRMECFPTSINSMFYWATSIETISLDLRLVTSISNEPFLMTSSLKNLYLKNIRVGFYLSGANYPNKLTDESLINTAKELWTLTSSKTISLEEEKVHNSFAVLIKLSFV